MNLLQLYVSNLQQIHWICCNFLKFCNFYINFVPCGPLQIIINPCVSCPLQSMLKIASRTMKIKDYTNLSNSTSFFSSSFRCCSSRFAWKWWEILLYLIFFYFLTLMIQERFTPWDSKYEREIIYPRKSRSNLTKCLQQVPSYTNSIM